MGLNLTRIARQAALVGLLAVFTVAPLQAQTPPVEAQPPAVDAPPPVLPVEVFASHDLFYSPRLAPDGSKLAVEIRGNDKGGVVVIDMATKKPLTNIRLDKGLEHNWHRWAGPDVVLASVSKMTEFEGEELRNSRLLAMRISTGERWWVGPKYTGPKGDDLLHVAKDGSSILLSMQQTIFDWPGVMHVSLLDPRDTGKLVQKPVDAIWDWYADDAGVVRMGTGWTNRKMRVLYRKSEGERLREIARLKEGDEDGFWDVGRIVSGSDEIHLLKEDDKGRIELARYNLATRTKLETVYRNESWDLSEAWLDDDGTPIAVDFTDDRDRRVWLKPDMAKLQKGFEKALKFDEVWIGSRSHDDAKMMVYGGGEADPGAYYLYDAAQRKLELFADLRPDLKVAHLARPRPVGITARDGAKMTAYLTVPRGRNARNLPLVIMPHGGPYGVRDKLAYDDEVQFLANRGYAVLQPNFRGSGGYGKAFEESGNGQIGRGMQDDLDDAMDWAVKEGIADKGRVCVVGASYGGYAAMWAVIRNPERYRCAASFAGVTDWKRILRYDAKFFTRKFAREWNAQVTGEEGFDLDTVAPARAIGRLTRPLLVAHGKNDTRVPFSQYKALVSAAEKAGVSFEPMVFEEAGHGFEKPEDKARWLSGLESFLRKHNPPD